MIVGKSTVGRSLTGSCRYATMPKNRMPIMTSVVMTGRRMNSAVIALPPLSTTFEPGDQSRLAIDYDLLAFLSDPLAMTDTESTVRATCTGRCRAVTALSTVKT